MRIYLIVGIICSLATALSFHFQWKYVEYVCKPAVMFMMLLWVFSVLSTHTVFQLAIFFSLLGDILLISEAPIMFVLGLVAFLLAHLAYIGYFFDALMYITTSDAFMFFSFLILFMSFVIRPIISFIRHREPHLIIPIIVYGFVIAIMTLCTLLTLRQPDWTTESSLLVSLGAISFFLSDFVLAWNKFVRPIPQGQIINILLYFGGQMAIVGGVILQHSK